MKKKNVLYKALKERLKERADAKVVFPDSEQAATPITSSIECTPRPKEVNFYYKE